MSVKHRVLQALAAGLLAGTALLPAHAAIVVGSFDPAFGIAFPNLGYRGALTVRVPDACFALTPGLITNGDACSGGQMQVLNATVELYNTSTPGTPTLTTLNFSPASLFVSSALTFFDVVTSTNQLLGINTSGSTPLSVILHDPGATGSVSDDVDFEGDLILSFFAQLLPTVDAAARLHACANPVGPVCAIEADSAPALTVFDPRVDEVPEPGTWALALAALGGLAAARRRRQATPQA